MKKLLSLVLALPVFAGSGVVAAQEIEIEEAVAQKKPYAVRALYPVEACLISGKKLGDDAETFEAGGRTFKTCCPRCKPKIEADPEKYIAQLDAAIVERQAPTYPLADCVVSGKKLGSMGDPHQLVIDGTLVQLCCNRCVKRAESKGAETVAKIRDASYAMQKASYPLDTCVVSGEKLEDPTDVMYGTTLVRMCCSDCSGDFEKNPAKYMAKLDKAAEKAGRDAEKTGRDAAKKAVDKAGKALKKLEKKGSR